MILISLAIVLAITMTTLLLGYNIDIKRLSYISYYIVAIIIIVKYGMITCVLIFEETKRV